MIACDVSPVAMFITSTIFELSLTMNDVQGGGDDGHKLPDSECPDCRISNCLCLRPLLKTCRSQVPKSQAETNKLRITFFRVRASSEVTIFKRTTNLIFDCISFFGKERDNSRKKCQHFCLSLEMKDIGIKGMHWGHFMRVAFINNILVLL